MAGDSYALCCLENPLLDIQGFGNSALLDKYGLKANDAILAEEKHMGIYEELLQNHDAKLIAGGAAQNTARGAQYMLPSHSVMYIGCIGKDKYGEILKEACQKAGIHTEYRIDDKQPTGRCGVVITGHDRSMCTHLAAANEYKLDHLQQPHVWKLVEEAQVYYVGAYHLTVCVPAIMAIAKEAASKNKVRNNSGLAAPFIPTFFKDQLAEVMPYTDYVLGNEQEAAAWAETQGLQTKSIPEIAKKMSDMPKVNSKRTRTVIITQGTEPAVVAISGESKVSEYPVHAIEKEKINDTNGAG
ncbi:MAG: hypothetical protein Q9227_007354 [Pyrenula ochraceoflavens]